jgi:hypothetical protein
MNIGHLGTSAAEIACIFITWHACDQGKKMIG